MENLRNLNNDELVVHLKNLVSKEREITLQILHHLREVEIRRLYALRGFASLHEFCVQYLGYSDAAAQRRISSMRLLKDFKKEEEQKIERALVSGELSLSTLSQVYGFCKNEKKIKDKNYTLQEKIELLENIRGKSKRETDKFFMKLSPDTVKKEQVRIVSEEHTELRVTVNDELFQKLERIKQILSHKNPNPTYAELMAFMAEIVLKKIDPAKKAIPTEPDKKDSESQKTALPVKSTPLAEWRKPKRYIPTATRQKVWQNAAGSCEYIDPKTNRRCTSQHKLQIDHVQPRVRGGATTLANLRLLCSQHNLLAAIQILGPQYMQKYLTT